MIERYRARGGGQIIVLDAVVVGLHLTRRSFRRFELTPQELDRGVDRFDAPPLDRTNESHAIAHFAIIPT